MKKSWLEGIRSGTFIRLGLSPAWTEPRSKNRLNARIGERARREGAP